MINLILRKLVASALVVLITQHVRRYLMAWAKRK